MKRDGIVVYAFLQLTAKYEGRVTAERTLTYLTYHLRLFHDHIRALVISW